MDHQQFPESADRRIPGSSLGLDLTGLLLWGGRYPRYDYPPWQPLQQVVDGQVVAVAAADLASWESEGREHLVGLEPPDPDVLVASQGSRSHPLTTG